MIAPTYAEVVAALADLVECIECDNRDAKPDARTYRLEGYVYQAVTDARSLMSEIREQDRVERAARFDSTLAEIRAKGGAS